MTEVAIDEKPHPGAERPGIVGLEISNAWKRYFGGCGGGLGTAVSNRIFQLPPHEHQLRSKIPQPQ
jgi:hypothetical protein